MAEVDIAPNFGLELKVPPRRIPQTFRKIATDIKAARMASSQLMLGYREESPGWTIYSNSTENEVQSRRNIAQSSIHWLRSTMRRRPKNPVA
jgi:hypothetical protein